MRVREVYIHAVDLAAGTSFRELPAEFLATLLDDVTVSRSAKGGGPAVIVASTDTGDRWDVAGSGTPVPVSAPLADLAAGLAHHVQDHGAGPLVGGAGSPDSCATA